MRSGDEVLFSGGTVFDGQGFLPAGTSVRVRAGKITEVGPAAAAGSAEVIDLDGGTLLPGFIDAHAHPVFAGDQLQHCDLRPATSAAGYLELIAAYAQAHPDEEWITGGGWSMDSFPGGTPTKEPLDAIVGDRPVYLPNRDGHGAWVSSRALELAGVTAATPDPADGRIERDAAGQPTGMLQEGATRLVARLLPEVTEDDWYQALLAAQRHLLSLGLTGWQDAIIGSYLGEADPLGAYLRAASAGTLTATVTGALWWTGTGAWTSCPSCWSGGGSARPTVPRHQREDDAGRWPRTTPRHARAVPGRRRVRSGHAGLDFIDPAEARPRT